MKASPTTKTSTTTMMIILLSSCISGVEAVELEAHTIMKLIIIGFCVFAILIVLYHCYLKRQKKNKFDTKYYDLESHIGAIQKLRHSPRGGRGLGKKVTKCDKGGGNDVKYINYTI